MGEVRIHSSGGIARGSSFPARAASSKSVFVFCLISLLLGLLAPASRAVIPPSGGISFGGLSGPNGSAFTGATEGDFTAAPTAGEWLQGTFYGNAAPSIVLGPLNSPGIGVLLITDSAGPFKFSGLDFSSNNGNSTYDILGFLGADNIYTETGTLGGTFGPFAFSTLNTPDSSVAVDSLVIEIIPGSGVTTVNIDNIDVATLLGQGNNVNSPETTSSLILLCLGLAGLACLRQRRLPV